MTSNLLLRGSRFSVRQFVTTELRTHIARTEIVKSLGTSNRKSAKIFLRRIQHIAERLFLLATLGLGKSELAILLQNNINAALNDSLDSDVTIATQVSTPCLNNTEKCYGKG